MGTKSLAPDQGAIRTLNSMLHPAASAFDAIARTFDTRFGEWKSVAAQRNAVRSALLRQFPPGGLLLELGGGTGEDAVYLAKHGFRVLTTDPSPAMVSIAKSKLPSTCVEPRVLAAEDLDEFAAQHLGSGGIPFDGAFSNFAPLNCVVDLESVAHGLARLLKPGASAMLVLFGSLCPGEVITETLRGRPRVALRRLSSGNVAARLAQHEFDIVYHRQSDLEQAFAPWFRLEKRLGIGITVPPSAAEPWISAHPVLLSAMERIDRIVSRPFAVFADHILYQFNRTSAKC